MIYSPYHCFIKQKQNIMNPSINSSEEYKGIVTVFLSNGHQYIFTADQLTAYVESNSLNESEVNNGSGLICDPNGRDECVTDVTPVAEWIDTNWDLAVAKYYEAVILKGN